MRKIAVLFLFLQLFALQVFAQQYKYHIIERGETTSEIARKYNISEETLFKYNPDARRGIKPNGKLVVPINAKREKVAQQENVQETGKFQMHKVKRKETLFSLSQQYNVSIEDIKRFNKHLYSEELRRGETIRIPKSTSIAEVSSSTPSPVNPLDLSVKEHVVLPQETLYSISRRYNVTIAELQRLNPRMETLQPGMVIKIRNGEVEKVIDVEGKLFKYYQVQPQETLFSLTRRFGISRDSLVSLNPALADGLKSGMVLKVPNPEVDAVEGYTEDATVNLERRINNYATKNLVVMLPFNKNKIIVTDSSSNVVDRIKNDKVMQVSLDFYSGVLVAIDSAKALGISSKVTFLDTQGNSGHVNVLLNTHNFDDVDAVIGPLVQSTVETAARGLERRNIPVVSPLTKKEAGSLENFLQTVPTDEMLADVMISYISENSAGKNLVIIADAGATEKRRKLSAAFPSAKIVTPGEGGNISPGAMAAALDSSRPNWVILESSRIGVLSNATSYLNSVADSHRVTLLTTDKNNSFDSDNVSNTHLARLNFHYPSVDRAFDPEKNRNFIKKYQEKYGVVPSRFAVRGFDVTYDVLLRLASAEDLYASINEEGTTQYVENKFDYDRRPAGGYLNKAIYILAYGRDLALKEVR